MNFPILYSSISKIWSSQDARLLPRELVVPLMFVVCTLSLLIQEILDTLILYLMMTRGSDVILGFSTIDALLLYCSAYHICMLMPFWDDNRSMRISSYMIYWTWLLFMLGARFYVINIYFILVSLCFLRMWMM